jgi:hypothetical protein
MGYTLLDEDGAPAKGRYTLLPDDTPKAKPFGQQLNDAIADVPRQLGLTARYGIEGAGGAFDSLVGNPLRTLAAPIFGNQPTANTGGTLANLLHLPTPQTAQERVVGDATRTLAGGAVPLGAAGALAGRTTGAAQAVARTLAANPVQQLTSAAAAGAAGGYTRETGGNEGAQLAGVAGWRAGGAGRAGRRTAGRRIGGAPPGAGNHSAAAGRADRNHDQQRAAAVRAERWATCRRASPAGIRNDVAAAYKTGGVLSPDAIRRLADYR